MQKKIIYYYNIEMITVKFKHSLSLLKDENTLVNGIVQSIQQQLEGVNMLT